MLWNIGEEIKKNDDQVGSLVVPIMGSNCGKLCSDLDRTIHSCPSPYGSITITDPAMSVDLDWLQSKAVSAIADEHYTKCEVLDLLREVLLAYEEQGLGSAMKKIEDIKSRGI